LVKSAGTEALSGDGGAVADGGSAGGLRPDGPSRGSGRPGTGVGDLRDQGHALRAHRPGVRREGVESLETGRAAVANKLINTHLRAVEAERKIKETDELEAILEQRDEGGRRWG
jgi:hypothetical protein